MLISRLPVLMNERNIEMGELSASSSVELDALTSLMNVDTDTVVSLSDLDKLSKFFGVSIEGLFSRINLYLLSSSGKVSLSNNYFEWFIGVNSNDPRMEFGLSPFLVKGNIAEGNLSLEILLNTVNGFSEFLECADFDTRNSLVRKYLIPILPLHEMGVDNVFSIKSYSAILLSTKKTFRGWVSKQINPIKHYITPDI